jgi:transcriptional regulator with XRE-family HTH domain
MNQTLPSYIKTRRKHAHMSQRELSYLMGMSTQGVIAQHESRVRLPQATSLFKYQALFDEPIGSLLPGARRQAERDVVSRARVLAARLERRGDRNAARKRAFLDALIGRLSPARA